MIQALWVHLLKCLTFLDVFASMVRKQLTVLLRYPIDFFVGFAETVAVILLLALAMLMFSPSGARLGGEGGVLGGVIVFGMILYMFLDDTLWLIGYSIRSEQYQGTLESLYLTPASKFASLVSRVSISLVWTGFNTLGALIFVHYTLGGLPFHNAGLAAFILIMTLLGTFGLGFAFAAFTLLAKETAHMMANLIEFGLLTLCAMFCPFSVLPSIVRVVSRFIPLSYCVDAFRSTLLGYPSGFPELLPIGPELAIVTCFGLLMPFLGYGLYRAAERKGRMDGSLAEF